jgi:hypothetical protein
MTPELSGSRKYAADSMERGGCVYLHPADPEVGEAPGWHGHWEKPAVDTVGPPIMSWGEALARDLVEEGHWASADDAIAWGRARSDHVLVYMTDDSDSIYSAGSVHQTPDGDGGFDVWPQWPPPPDIWSGDET